LVKWQIQSNRCLFGNLFLHWDLDWVLDWDWDLDEGWDGIRKWGGDDSSDSDEMRLSLESSYVWLLILT
jgi:hypothetical protein